jgi:transposase
VRIRPRWKEVDHGKPYRTEFRDDVVAVARKGQAPLAQTAKDVGISEGTLSNWIKRADIEDGNRPGLTEEDRRNCARPGSGSGCWSRRTRSCAGLPPICRRRTCREIAFPLVREMAATGARIRVPVAVACRVLGLSAQGSYK